MYPISAPSKHRSKNTDRAWAQVVNDFFQITQLNIYQASDGHISMWIDSMYDRRLSIGTIRQRLSILNQIIPGLHAPLPQRHYPEKFFLDSEQLTAFLLAIPKNQSGRFDFLLFALISKGLKSTEVRLIQWKHFYTQNNALVMRLAGKTITLSLTVQKLYMQLSGKAQSRDGYVFQASTDHYLHFGHASGSTASSNPLSASEINRRSKKYARQACLDYKKISARTLNYSAEELGHTVVNQVIDLVAKHYLPMSIPWMRLDQDSKSRPSKS